MSNNSDWRIPPSVLHGLLTLPKNCPIAVLLRHSVREELPPDGVGYSLPITEAGTRLAQELGGMIGTRLRSIHTSPLTRCVQTAEALQYGAGTNLRIELNNHLGDPGVFVIDGQRAIRNWERLGHEGVMKHLVASDQALPGMAQPDPAAGFLVHHILSIAGNTPGLHLFITHDLLVTATVARLLHEPELEVGDWPWYLEGAFFWRHQESVHIKYRNLGVTKTYQGLINSSEKMGII